jgi:hypothetical protein|tara:strand:+ start:2305 stop:2826 length:522 start_codon:yes stop_codon:yes gene_type:complete
MPKDKPKDKGGRRTRLVEDRNLLGKLYKTAISYMKSVLEDDLRDADGKPLKDKGGKRVVATVNQKLAVALRIVDQHIGRPPQAVDLTSNVPIQPASITEVVLTLEEPSEIARPEVSPAPSPSETPPPAPDLLPFEPQNGDDVAMEEGWIDKLEGGLSLAGSDPDHPVFTTPAV